MSEPTLNKIIKEDLSEDGTFKLKPKRWEKNKSRDELRQCKHSVNANLLGNKETDMQGKPKGHDLGSTSFQGKLLPWNGLKWAAFNIPSLSDRCPRPEGDP